MSFFIYYFLPFVIVLGILVFFHELGHFLVAKYFGVKVLKFSLGFGYKLVGKKVGETEYLISTIPLGGYVKLLGEDSEEAEDASPADSARSFNNQHVLKRIAIVAAGPVFNLVLAWLLFCGAFLVSGNYVMTSEIGQVRADSPADRAGLRKGDTIVSVQGRPIEGWPDIKKVVQEQEGTPLQVVVKRGDQLLPVTVTPEFATEKNIFGEEVKSALIGIVASGNFKEIALGPWGSLVEGTAKTWDVIKLTFLTIVKLLQGVVSIKTLGGPIMIGQLTGQVAQESISYLIPLLAIISINLAILNLLPIPILDGGLIVFLLIELVAGKPVGLKKRDIAQKVGLLLLAVLIVVVTINDLSRIEVVSRFFGRFFP